MSKNRWVSELVTVTDMMSRLDSPGSNMSPVASVKTSADAKGVIANVATTTEAQQRMSLVSF